MSRYGFDTFQFLPSDPVAAGETDYLKVLAGQSDRLASR